MSELRIRFVSVLNALRGWSATRRWVLLTSCAGVLMLGFSLAFAQSSDEEPDETARQKFMLEKLEMVHQVVEGIATEDFDLVTQGAMRMASLSESATFRSEKDPFYGHYSGYFEKSVRDLIAAAKSESVERTTFAYVHVTFSCTACHQHVRGTKRVAQ